MSKQFTTSRGVTLEFLPIPALLEKLQSQHRMPDPPTYEVKTVTGAVEIHTHDETTLETDTDRAAWAEYQKNLADATAKLNLALMRLVMLRGVRVVKPDDGPSRVLTEGLAAVQLPEMDESWVKEQEFIGLKVPTDPLDRRMHWLETEALASTQDYAQLLAGVMQASGISEEIVAQAEATFRGAVGDDATGGPAAQNNGHELAHKPAVRANARRGQKRHTGH